MRKIITTILAALFGLYLSRAIYALAAFILALFMAGCIQKIEPPAAAEATRTPPQAAHVAQATTATRTPPQATEARSVTCSVLTGQAAGTLHVRACAAVTCAAVGYLAEGETVTILEAGAWHKVKAGNVTGYVNSEFCK